MYDEYIDTKHRHNLFAHGSRNRLGWLAGALATASRMGSLSLAAYSMDMCEWRRYSTTARINRIQIFRFISESTSEWTHTNYCWHLHKILLWFRTIAKIHSIHWHNQSWLIYISFISILNTQSIYEWLFATINLFLSVRNKPTTTIQNSLIYTHKNVYYSINRRKRTLSIHKRWISSAISVPQYTKRTLTHSLVNSKRIVIYYIFVCDSQNILRCRSLYLHFFFVFTSSSACFFNLHNNLFYQSHCDAHVVMIYTVVSFCIGPRWRYGKWGNKYAMGHDFTFYFSLISHFYFFVF